MLLVSIPNYQINAPEPGGVPTRHTHKSDELSA